MIKFKQKGDFKKTESFLNKLLHAEHFDCLDEYAQLGVEALSSATPKDTGLTSESWGYVIDRKKDKTTITWTNSNTQDGVNIAIILQYGHGTGTGGYVEGRDYINPAIKPIFDMIENKVWKEVSLK